MDSTVLVAIIGVLGVLGTGGMALIGQIGNRRQERARESSAQPDKDVARMAAVIDDLESQNARVIAQRNDSNEALAKSLLRVGIVEAYAHELEVTLGIAHRVWTERLDTLPEATP